MDKFQDRKQILLNGFMDHRNMAQIRSSGQIVIICFTQHNRNRLLWDKTLVVDGIKTGHVSEVGYNLAFLPLARKACA